MELDGPGAPSVGTKLTTPTDALRLPVGRLAVPFAGMKAEASFSPEDVAGCAQLIIDNQDATTFYSQAGVIAHAGNKHGWGLGGGYSTL